MRHVFLQRAGDGGLVTRDLRGDSTLAAHGLVQDAPYLTRASRGWLWRLVPWMTTPEPRPEDLRFALPFDADGGDGLRLVAPAPRLDGMADPPGAVRRVAGPIVCLEPRASGDEVVLRDFWLESPPVLRIVEMIDFGVLPPSGPPVAVCCAMAPLIIARSSPASVGDLVAELGPRASTELLRHAAPRRHEIGERLTLQEGEEVEVIGVVHTPREGAKRFGDRSRSAPYRGAPQTIELLLGDVPGDRLVVSKQGA